MSFWKKLFGGGGASSTVPDTAETYRGFTIRPTPLQEGKVYRLSATIEKDVDGQTKVHHLIRADTIADRDDAVSAAIEKAKQVIDEQGERLFS